MRFRFRPTSVSSDFRFCLVPVLDGVPCPQPVLCPSDIRDTVNYKEVMKQYGLGPNGGIVTALNLFATRFDQVTRPGPEYLVLLSPLIRPGSIQEPLI